MTQSFYGPNMLNHQPSDDLIVRWNPAVVLGVGGVGRLLHFQNLLPDSHMIFRDWYPDPASGDDNLSNNDRTPMSAKDKIDRMAGLAPDDRIWLYLENEPAANQRHLDWQMAGAEHAKRIGRRVILENYAMGNPTDMTVYNSDSFMIPLWRWASDNPDVAMIGVHEYAEQYNPDSRLTYIKLRYRRIQQHAPNALFVLTEDGFDDLDERFMGWRPSPGLPHLTPDQFVAKMVYAWSLYRPDPNMVGSTLFCYGDNDQPRWWRYDIRALGEEYLIALADATRMSITEPTIPEDYWLDTIYSLRGYCNARSGPGLDHEVITQVPSTGLEVWYNARESRWEEDSQGEINPAVNLPYLWMDFYTHNGYHLFVREDVIKRPALINEGQSCEDRIQALEQLNQELTAKTQALQAKIDNAVEVLTS